MIQPLKFNKIRTFYGSHGLWQPLRDAEDYIDKYKENISYLDIDFHVSNINSGNVILKMWWED
jgi:hypothetical protein